MMRRHHFFRTASVAGLVAFFIAAGASVTYATVHPPRTGWALPTSSTTSTTVHKVPAKPGVTTTVSTPRAIEGYASPGGRATTTVPTTWLGSPLVMPVIGTAPGYFDVRLPSRPNGSTAWIKSAGLIISATPFKIVVNLTTKHLQLLKYGEVIFSAPVGVGTAQYPTPTGNYYVGAFAAPPNSSYGPFVMVTTAHSNKITDWAGSGDAVVAIHGPIGADRQIGTTGARVSHGCIRMHVADQVHLAVVSIGTPVTITY